MLGKPKNDAHLKALTVYLCLVYLYSMEINVYKHQYTKVTTLFLILQRQSN